jgi:hypothetical protein
VIFGVAANVSISKLFMAGIFPGICWLSRCGSPGGGPGAQGNHRTASAQEPAEVMDGAPGSDLGAGAAADHRVRPEVWRLHADRGRRGGRGVCAARLRLVYRELTWRMLYPLFVAAAKTCAIVMFLVAAAMVSAWLITVASLPARW